MTLSRLSTKLRVRSAINSTQLSSVDSFLLIQFSSANLNAFSFIGHNPCLISLHFGWTDGAVSTPLRSDLDQLLKLTAITRLSLTGINEFVLKEEEGDSLTRGWWSVFLETAAPRLKKLKLVDCNVAEHVLIKSLQNVPNLTHLHLSQLTLPPPPATPPLFTQIFSLRHLSSLSLSQFRSHSAAFANITSLSSLSTLKFSNCPTDQTVLTYVTKISSLVSLSLNSTLLDWDLSRRDVSQLSQLKLLTYLNIADTPLVRKLQNHSDKNSNEKEALKEELRALNIAFIQK